MLQILIKLLQARWVWTHPLILCFVLLVCLRQCVLADRVCVWLHCFPGDWRLAADSACWCFQSCDMELSQDYPGSHACPYTHRHKCRQRCRHAQTELLQRCKYVCIHTYTWPALWVVVVGVAACGHAGKETRRWNMLEEDMLDGSMGVSGGGAELCAVYHVSHQ